MHALSLSVRLAPGGSGHPPSKVRLAPGGPRMTLCACAPRCARCAAQPQPMAPSCDRERARTHTGHARPSVARWPIAISPRPSAWCLLGVSGYAYQCLKNPTRSGKNRFIQAKNRSYLASLSLGSQGEPLVSGEKTVSAPRKTVPSRRIYFTLRGQWRGKKIKPKL